MSEEYERKKQICDCNNILVAVEESKKYYTKNGLVFNKKTGECLGTIFQLNERKRKFRVD